MRCRRNHSAVLTEEPVRQYVDDFLPIEIHQDGAETCSLAPYLVVDADHAHWRVVLPPPASLPELSEQRMPADRNAELHGQPFRPLTHSMTRQADDIIQPRNPQGMGGRRLWQPFREDDLIKRRVQAPISD